MRDSLSQRVRSLEDWVERVEERVRKVEVHELAACEKMAEMKLRNRRRFEEMERDHERREREQDDVAKNQYANIEARIAILCEIIGIPVFASTLSIEHQLW